MSNKSGIEKVFPYTRGGRTFTPEEARIWRRQVDVMEAAAAADPDLLHKPVVALRLEQINERNQELVFGPDWKKDMYSRECVMCRTALVVRPVFQNNPMTVCTNCAPEFFESLGKGANA